MGDGCHAAQASTWRLLGPPTVAHWLRCKEGPTRYLVPSVFVQRSGIRGRPWLRFGLALDGCGCCLVWRSPTAYKTKHAALAG